MKRSWFVLSAVGAVAACSLIIEGASNQSSTPRGGRVAVCNVALILENSLRTKPLKDELRSKEEQLKTEGDQRAKAIEASQKELQSYKEGSAEYEKKLNDILKATVELEAWKNTQERLLGRWHYRVTREMFEEIRLEVEKIAKEQGYDIVLQKQPIEIVATNSNQLVQELSQRNVLYSNASVDITETVLAKINKSASAAAKP